MVIGLHWTDGVFSTESAGGGLLWDLGSHALDFDVPENIQLCLIQNVVNSLRGDADAFSTGESLCAPIRC